MIENIEKISFRSSKIGLERVMIFMDHANVFHNLEKLNLRIDYGKLKLILAKNQNLMGAIIYMGLPKDLFPKKRSFLAYLKSNGFIIQKRSVIFASNGKMKQVGVEKFVYRDMIELAEEDIYDKAVLVSGDGDFIDAVVKLKQLGKDIEIWSFKRSLSHSLLEKATKENVHYLDDIIDKIKLH